VLIRVIIDRTSPDHTAAAVAHMLAHHARGKVAITVLDPSMDIADGAYR
jgi:hypothetical protein